LTRGVHLICTADRESDSPGLALAAGGRARAAVTRDAVVRRRLGAGVLQSLWGLHQDTQERTVNTTVSFRGG
jgi:hypothetical protein